MMTPRSSFGLQLGFGLALVGTMFLGEGNRQQAAPPADEAVLGQRVRTTLLDEMGWWAADPIRIDVKGNLVILQGEVENEADRRQAEELAGSVDGVSGVESKLLVRTAQKPRPKHVGRHQVEKVALVAATKTGGVQREVDQIDAAC